MYLGDLFCEVELVVAESCVDRAVSPVHETDLQSDMLLLLGTVYTPCVKFAIAQSHHIIDPSN